MNVALEHGTKVSDLNVTNDDPVVTGKIALAHLREFPDYTSGLRSWSGKPTPHGQWKLNVRWGRREPFWVMVYCTISPDQLPGCIRRRGSCS